MSNFNLGKKLLPSKKAWKSFTNKLQSRLHKLKLSKAIKSSKNLCIRAYNYIFPIITRKFYSLINRSSPPRTRRNFYHNYYQYQQCHKGTSPIYVDQLFPEPIQKSEKTHSRKISAPQAKEFVASSSNVNVNRRRLDQEEQEIILRAIEKNTTLKKGKVVIESGTNYRTCDNIDEWRTPSMPHINGVDRRAEEFISKFREDMELERQQSILDFQEMLARGA
ncbi:uncharacterized protein LOC132061390 [Lycium ferocissimum]|uniref:uncharacterized protein LOC132061390 n=1 Tax=Lycium ferocissimum TaxID=112874 RepID=UPI00281611C0|nr:uncharacterized protein LOC132061390 [Lycium ferocissimum]